MLNFVLAFAPLVLAHFNPFVGAVLQAGSDPALFSGSALQWVAALGAIATVVALIMNLRVFQRQSRLQEQEARDRHAAQARKVHMHYPTYERVIEEDFEWNPYANDAEDRFYALRYVAKISNSSDEEIRQVHAEVHAARPRLYEEFSGGTTAVDSGRVWIRIAPGQTAIVPIEFSVNLKLFTPWDNETKDLELVTFLNFTDSSGTRWSRDERGVLHEGESKYDPGKNYVLVDPID